MVAQLKVLALDSDCLLSCVAGDLQHLQLHLVDGIPQLHVTKVEQEEVKKIEKKSKFMQ